jgi:beta-phosphoglucomutase
MFKFIIFDMDGVLIDSIPNHLNAWSNSLKKIDIKIKRELLALNEGANQINFLKRVLKEANLNLTKQQMKKVVNEKNLEFKSKKIKPYPIIKYLKKNHKKGIKMAIATGGLKEIAKQVNKTYFDNIFNVIIASQDVTKGKPNKETYIKALKLLKANKKETLVIENAPLGIKSAKSAGLTCYALETTLNKKYLKEADKIFKNHKELFEFIG